MYDIGLEKDEVIPAWADDVDENGYVKIKWEDYKSYYNWRHKQLCELTKPLKEFMKLHMVSNTIEITKDWWKIK